MNLQIWTGPRHGAPFDSTGHWGPPWRGYSHLQHGSPWSWLGPVHAAPSGPWAFCDVVGGFQGEGIGVGLRIFRCLSFPAKLLYVHLRIIMDTGELGHRAPGLKGGKRRGQLQGPRFCPLPSSPEVHHPWAGDQTLVSRHTALWLSAICTVSRGRRQHVILRRSAWCMLWWGPPAITGLPETAVPPYPGSSPWRERTCFFPPVRYRVCLEDTHASRRRCPVGLMGPVSLPTQGSLRQLHWGALQEAPGSDPSCLCLQHELRCAQSCTGAQCQVRAALGTYTLERGGPASPHMPGHGLQTLLTLYLPPPPCARQPGLGP